MMIVGYILIGLGLVLILLGVVAAAFLVFQKQGQGVATAQAGVGEIVKALPKIIEELSKAPKWLAFTIVGLIILVLGVQLVNGGPPFGHAASPPPATAAANATS